MAELVKQWNDGENLTVTYTGSGDGLAVFSSEINEGIDKEIGVVIKTTKGNNTDSKAVTVKQVGLREVFKAADGDFNIADGGTLNVLKDGLQ